MIHKELFNSTEPLMLHLVNLWNAAEADPGKYDLMFVSNPHELAQLVGAATSYNDWQEFLADSRVQEYLDRIIYAQAGIIVNSYMQGNIRVGMADTAKLNSAIKYRDDHKNVFAPPTQYIYIQTPLTSAEKEFLPDVPENKVSRGGL